MGPTLVICSKFLGHQMRGVCRGEEGRGQLPGPHPTPANTHLASHDLISSMHNCQVAQVWASKDAPDFDAIYQFYLVQLSF